MDNKISKCVLKLFAVLLIITIIAIKEGMFRFFFTLLYFLYLTFLQYGFMIVCMDRVDLVDLVDRGN